MQQGLTELVFILDKSGSMSGLEHDTIGGYNGMLAKQQAVEGECRITTVLFDHGYELLHDRLDIRAVGPITEDDYFAGGSTALLDAIGHTIRKIGSAQQHTAEAHRAEMVMFVIITDGYENASRRYTAERVKQMIEHQKDHYGWEFIFLGANIDAVETAGRFGIAADRAQNFHADRDGVELNFRVTGEAVTTLRRRAPLASDWSAEIQQDYERRGSKR